MSSTVWVILTVVLGVLSVLTCIGISVRRFRTSALRKSAKAHSDDFELQVVIAPPKPIIPLIDPADQEIDQNLKSCAPEGRLKLKDGNLRPPRPTLEGFDHRGVAVKRRNQTNSKTAPNAFHELDIISQGDQLSDLKRELWPLAESNYTIDVAVIVENSLQQGSNRPTYEPAKIKFDTGSDINLVSREFLNRIGFPMNDLVPIPADDQAVVHGINKARFTPKFQVDLQRSRQGNMRIDSDRFVVVDEAPFELLLQSQRLLEGLHLSCLHLVRPKKSKDVIEQERQEEQKRIKAAKALEEEEYRREMARRETWSGRG